MSKEALSAMRDAKAFSTTGTADIAAQPCKPPGPPVPCRPPTCAPQPCKCTSPCVCSTPRCRVSEIRTRR